MHRFPEPYVCGGERVFASFPVPFKDPQVLGDCWRHQAEYRDLQGTRLGFDVGMKEDSGLLSVRADFLASFGMIFELSKNCLSALRKKWDGVAQRYKGQEVGRSLPSVTIPPGPRCVCFLTPSSSLCLSPHLRSW